MEQLGINPTLLVTQIINFSILLALLGKFAYKPMLKMMQDRQKRIEKGLELTRTMEEERAKLDERVQKALDKAQEKAERVLSRAKEEGEKEREKIIKEARQEAKRVIDEGLKVLQTRQEEEQKKMRADIADLVVRLSEKLLSERISPKKHREILAKQIRELSRKDVSKIH